MKKFLLFITVACVGVFFSCKEIDVPTGGFAWYDEGDFIKRENPNPNPVQLGQPLIFISTSNDANMYTVWFGEKGFDYTKRFLADSLLSDTLNRVSSKNQGKPLVLLNNEYRTQSTYKYSNIGDYTVYFVSRNFNDKEKIYEEVVDSMKITVIDTIAELFGTDETKYRFRTSVPSKAPYTVDGDKVTLLVPYDTDLSEVVILIKADRAQVSFDQALIDTVTSNGTVWKLNLETDRTITVTSASGYSNTYTLTAVKGTAPIPSSEKEILSFSVAGYDAEITGTTINVDVPSALDLTTVTPIFTLSDGATVSVGGVEQVSNETVSDLTAVLTYTVEAEDGTTTDYTVTASTIPTQMSSFYLSNLNPTIGSDNIIGTSIDLTVFTGTDITSLIPSITMTKFAQAFYNNGTDDVNIESGVTEIDFTAPVEIFIYSPVDTVKYTVTVGF